MTAYQVGGICACLVLAGCASPISDTPHAVNFPVMNQLKLQSAGHWNIVAADMAKRIVKSLGEKKPIYIVKGKDPSPFEKAVVAQLASSLLTYGFPVMNAEGDALKLSLDVQAVQFTPRRPYFTGSGKPEDLGGGVWVRQDSGASVDTTASVGMTASSPADGYYSEYAMGGVPRMEVLVAVGVSNASKLVARASGVYYVADGDMDLYKAPRLPSTSIGVKGGE